MITQTTISEDDGKTRGEGDKQGFHLLVMSPDAFSSQPLPGSGVVTIGRSARCMVQIQDLMASREHAKMRVDAQGETPALTIEDVGSANGTRVRDTVIRPGEPTAILPGEAIMIGATVLMVLQDWAPTGLRRIWSHAYFEARVDDECARAAKSRGSFALVRIRFGDAAPWTKVMSVMARHLLAPHMFATYGPKDYELLLLDTQPNEVDALVQQIVRTLETAGIEAQCATAWYPKDGRTSDALLAAANGLLKQTPDLTHSGEFALAQASGMDRVRTLAMRAASSSINVLILGEMGVGKDVLARMIHQMSPRAKKPFLALNCGGLPEALLESELFGHEKGAFTGATGTKAGLFEAADGGTVFLDEIGEMPLPMQVKLLQVLETREVRRVGGPLKGRRIDVRFISATNVDIEAAVQKGTFRGDLMYRLNTLSLSIPPLRDRRDEIPALVSTFLERMSRDFGRAEPIRVSDDAMACLLGYSWPGNIRELRNVIERAVVLCDGHEIQPDHLPLDKLRPITSQFIVIRPGQSPDAAKPAPELAVPDAVAERQRIVDALEACGYNQTRAAARLGVSRRTLISRLDLYGIVRPQKRAQSETGFPPTTGEKNAVKPTDDRSEPPEPGS